MAYYLLSNKSRKRICIISFVLLHHLLWLGWEILIPVSTPEPERMLVLAPTQYRLCIVGME